MCPCMLTYMTTVVLYMYTYVMYVLLKVNIYLPPFIYVIMYVDIYVKFCDMYV